MVDASCHFILVDYSCWWAFLLCPEGHGDCDTSDKSAILSEKFVQESFVAGYLLFNNSIFGFGKYSSRKCFYLILCMMRDELICRQIETTNFSKQDTKIIMLLN